MNSEDEIETMLQEKKELEDLVNSQEMKDLDELLESIEDRDHYYSEIFDTLMTVWKQRELEGEELQRGNNRTRSCHLPVPLARRVSKTCSFDTIHEELSKSNIGKQLEDVLKNEGNKTKYSDKHKRAVESRPQPTKTIRTEKNPASNAHAKELSLVVQPRREKDEDGEKDKGKGMRARGVGKVDKIRQTMHAFSIYGP